MDINWYPGHMAKTKRLLQDQIRQTDLVIELCDSRLPHSSRNPDLVKMIGKRNHILLMNKADLADPEMNRRWVSYFEKQGLAVELIQARMMKSKDALGTIERMTRGIVEKAAEKGMHKTVRAMVIGVPNVGKSTYINRLHGGTIAKTGDRPGVTKSNQWIHVTPYLDVLDTPGMLWPRLDDQRAAQRLSYIGTIRDEILNLDDLSIQLLNDLADTVPERVSDRFHVSDMNLRGLELMDAVCQGRGFLTKGGAYDYDRCCSVVLDEFRGGKLGRITMEKPPEGRVQHGETEPGGKNSDAGSI